MQIKEFEAYTLKECLQQVRDELGPDAVILETRKFRKGGLLGVGARDAVCIVAATGIAVKDDAVVREASANRSGAGSRNAGAAARAAGVLTHATRSETTAEPAPAGRTPYSDNAREREAAPQGQAAAIAAARSAYGRQNNMRQTRAGQADDKPARTSAAATVSETQPRNDVVPAFDDLDDAPPVFRRNAATAPRRNDDIDGDRFGQLERAMREIRDGLLSLQREQKEAQERTVSAVVSAVTPALSSVTGMPADLGRQLPPALVDLNDRLLRSGMSESLAQDLLDALPDLSAWSEPAREPLAQSALRDLIGRRICCGGPIKLTPGRLKAVALIGPTGVGKTTTIAKLAAHFALVERKRVALLTVDTYRIAAVEQLKTYSQILDIPISVAYNQSEVMPVIEQYQDYDLLLIDTAGRSQKNIMQVGELKSLLELANCETHLVLSASMKEQDMLDAARRFSAARVDRMIFSKLDETDSHGTLVGVGDSTGIPLSYVTNGQKVPEDIEVADAVALANAILNTAS
jgi:flagellar biosynthesis protein FlhF